MNPGSQLAAQAAPKGLGNGMLIMDEAPRHGDRLFGTGCHAAAKQQLACSHTMSNTAEQVWNPVPAEWCLDETRKILFRLDGAPQRSAELCF